MIKSGGSNELSIRLLTRITGSVEAVFVRSFDLSKQRSALSYPRQVRKFIHRGDQKTRHTTVDLIINCQDGKRAIADKVGALLLADIAHPAGLIAAGLLNNPMYFAHIVTSTTHKTLRGPRGGIIMLGKNFENPWGRTTQKGTMIKMGTILDSGVFPGMQGGPLEHVIAAKAVAFHECLQPEFKAYGRQVIKNAQVMANAFVQKGYKIISGGTENHLMLIDLRSKNVTGKQAQESLVLADITINKNAVPFDTLPPAVTSGIRIGSSAITTRGFVEADCVKVVDWVDEIIMNIGNEEAIRKVRGEVNVFMENFPLYQERVLSTEYWVLSIEYRVKSIE